MFLDASAIVAILVEEEDAAALTRRMEQAAVRYTSPVAIYEAALGVARVRNVRVSVAFASLDQFLEQTATRLVAITAETGRAAVSAFDRYGRGRHPAALNMGDCFAYAAARALSVPLLFKGNDFPQTDIEAA